MNANESLNQLTQRMARQLAEVQTQNSYAVQIGKQKKHNEAAQSIPDLVAKMERGGVGPISNIQRVQAGYWILSGGPAPVHVWKNT